MAQPGIIELAEKNYGLVGAAITFFGIVCQMLFYAGMRWYQLKQLEKIQESHDRLQDRVAYIEGHLGI